MRQATFATISILEIFRPTLDGLRQSPSAFPEEWIQETHFLNHQLEFDYSIEQRGSEYLTVPVSVRVPSRVESRQRPPRIVTNHERFFELKSLFSSLSEWVPRLR
jgi:hypothetical protein